MPGNSQFAADTVGQESEINCAAKLIGDHSRITLVPYPDRAEGTTGGPPLSSH